jgi:hypothetical protein
MRGGRAYILLSIYLIIASLIVFFIFIGVISSSSMGPSPEDYKIAGKAIFSTVVFLQFGLISFIAPALTAGSISSERERLTYDLVRTTLLTAPSFVWGKLLSSIAFLALLLFVSLPFQSIAYLLGGLEISELIVSTLMLSVTTLAFCAAGIFFSALIKRTLPATILTYVFSGGTMTGVPTTLSFILALVGPLAEEIITGRYTSGEAPSLLTIIFLAVIIWFAIITNPIFTAVLSEILLIEEQELFIWMMPTSLKGPDIPIISPWIGYCLFYFVLSLVLIAITTSIVKRKDSN